MASSPAPFAPFEWMIAWRYLRSRRAEGGVSVMTWISLIGITLAVFALVATLAIREGLRSDLIQTMLGANAHAEIHYQRDFSTEIPTDHLIRDYEDLVEKVGKLKGVTHVTAVVRGQVLGSYRGRNVPVDVYGIMPEDLQNSPLIATSKGAIGDLSRFDEGIAIGAVMARQLGVGIGDRIKLISPNGVKTPMGTSPRVSAFEIVYIFTTGQGIVDQSRLYMPLGEAQSFFNREGAVDQVDLRLNIPEEADQMAVSLLRAGGPRAYVWTWQDRAGGMIKALKMQDNAIFVVLSILVLIAALNIVSGLIMLVKNKGRDIGILRTMGLSQGSILRVFFICGASVGTIGTLFGVILGVIFAANIDSI